MKKLYIFFLMMMITKGFIFAEDIKVKSIKWNEAVLEVVE